MTELPPPATTRRAGRVLVLILAYNAERHICGVLERIPLELLNTDEVHFLVLDDASGDAGVEAALGWVAEHDVTNVTVLRNGVNQGYGGNQKLGFRLAVDCAFDFAVLLHGDGQYSPTLLPDVIEVWRRTGADVVLGTRMWSAASARRGGMPAYKIVGNRILTRLQNLLTGESLSEYHTGLRGYATAFLRRVPFEINTNDFHFDTEILLQAFHARARVAEMNIPTHYGDEHCYVNGLKYAYDVLKATLQFRLQQKGMFCSLKYRNPDRTSYADKTGMAYSSHRMALDLIRKVNPRKVLDVGCGAGFVARECEKAGARVTGLDQSPPPPDAMSAFISARLDEDECPVNLSDFDLVLLLDVIEHLNEPEQFLLKLRESYQSRRAAGAVPPPVILSTPNVAFVTVRLNLLLGKFTYAERGILDITHRRLFTRGSLVRMLEDCGYQIEKVLPVPVPFDAVFGGRLGPPLTLLSRLLCAVWPRLFAFQFIVLCRPRPGARQLLTESEQLLIAEEDFYSVLRPHVVDQAARTGDTAVN
ncbi:MAG: glycosyltransferase [Acidobacteria bacterium]|nr:glycosyltransferase [Acidobacteriota bacterium]